MHWPIAIARLAPCAVLVASGLAASKADAVRDHLANAGFTDIAVFTGTAPALDAENMSGRRGLMVAGQAAWRA